MASSTLERSRPTEGSTSTDDAALRRRMQEVHEKYRKYLHTTFDELGVASEKETKELQKWALETRMTESDVADREKWYPDYIRRMAKAKELSDHFLGEIKDAQKKGHISKESHDEWVKRFKDPAVNYKKKEYWVQHQLPSYRKAWQKVSEDREGITKEHDFAALCTVHPEFKVLQKEHLSVFLALHYDERSGLVKEAKAALTALRRQETALFREARDELLDAEHRGFIAPGKSGVWLQRIFGKKATPAQRLAFIRGTEKGPHTLRGLKLNWQEVKEEYDKVSSALLIRGEAALPRGFHLCTPRQFLSMHFIERQKYVAEAKERLKDLEKKEQQDPDVFLEIRFAIDSKDWEGAVELLEEAATLKLSPAQEHRLESMRGYVEQFARHRLEHKDDARTLAKAKKRIDTILRSEMPLCMRDITEEGMKSQHANRYINQLRWMEFNNHWTRKHGYLNDHMARAGASDDNRLMTKWRAENGVDVGKNDVIDRDTADRSYFRKKEFSSLRPTYLHLNASSRGAKHALSEWLKLEQNPRVLYWTTLCTHEDGEPKSENWNMDFLHSLTELRSLTRVLDKHNLIYNGEEEPLRPKSGTVTAGKKAEVAVEQEYAMAA